MSSPSEEDLNPEKPEFPEAELGDDSRWPSRSSTAALKEELDSLTLQILVASVAVPG